MKTAIATLIVSAAFVASAAQAADTSPTKTRAQVVAELQQARELGLLSRGELDYPPAHASTDHKSRDEVLAELAEAKATGQLSTGELDYPPVATSESNKTRAQVVQEMRDYVSAGHQAQIEA